LKANPKNNIQQELAIRTAVVLTTEMLISSIIGAMLTGLINLANWLIPIK
jgi:hypothetical protein